jgi:3-oxoacyl-[acyl-carrier-protein] synthase III
MTTLAASAYVLGAERVALADWGPAHGLVPAQVALLQAHGVAHFHQAGPGAAVLRDMAADAIGSALEQARLAPGDIDALAIYQTVPCNTVAPPASLGAQLRERCGLDKALAFGVQQQMCVSPVVAMDVLRTLFRRRPHWRHALVVGADTILLSACRSLGGVGIHSDGAGALVLSREGGSRVRGLVTYNEPEGMQRLAHVPGLAEEGGQFDGYAESANYLWTLISVLRRILQQAGVQPAALASVLPNNVNLPAWQAAMKALRIPAERLFTSNIARTGHVFGSDIAANLSDSGALRTPGLHLVFASGVGGCFGGFILETEPTT